MDKSKCIQMIGGDIMYKKAKYTRASALQTKKLVSNNTRYFGVAHNNITGTKPSDFFTRSSHQPWWPTSKKKESQSAAELLVKCLEAKNVHFVFGQLRDSKSLLEQALHQSSIQFIPTRHSGEAASMAHVHSRFTGQAGVCLATSMQSILNSLPAVAVANLNNIPLILITEQSISNYLAINTQENLNLNNIIAPVTQWSHQIDHPVDIPEVVHKAFAQAEIGTDIKLPGAVHINLPTTTAIRSTSATPLKLVTEKKVNPNTKLLSQAAQWISRVDHPIILVGSGAIQSEGRSQVIKLATQLEIPVANTVMAKGIIPENHPLSVGTVASSKDYSRYGFDWADLVITIGCHPTECTPKDWNPDGDIPTLHIGQSSAEITPYYHPTLELVGNLPETLAAFLNRANRQDKYKVASPKGYAISSTTPRQQSHEIQIPCKPQALIKVLRTALKSEDILLSDNGTHREWIIRDYPCELPNKCLLFNESASTGLVISGAIATKLTNPQHNVLAVTGADGFMKSYSALEPAQWLKTPFVTLICNQGGYYPNFVEIAKSMGFRGYRITSSDDLLPIVKDSLTQQVPIIIDCPMDY
ncbi:acetolactate synthase [Leptolyngbya sp. Heron Island J]|uniref:thiamine pyrophosphate-binding protein n=1 Tax=Leptolyngbya sp. Heron Island J TaxID=1385935 RepID=UPI0003B94B8C|nr:thiamine pyrophosphate-binding protein [Leptolyngbya sp. Heron Island J]ESA32754.1 acetolactate synthase [Leptolyngbya sp. Heron Island J]